MHTMRLRLRPTRDFFTLGWTAFYQVQTLTADRSLTQDYLEYGCLLHPSLQSVVVVSPSPLVEDVVNLHSSVPPARHS